MIKFGGGGDGVIKTEREMKVEEEIRNFEKSWWSRNFENLENNFFFSFL